jgi:hypothetical protein
MTAKRRQGAGHRTPHRSADWCVGCRRTRAAAAAAKAVLYHVSTAFVHTTAIGERGRTAIGYASSKSAAEQVVRSSGVPHVILSAAPPRISSSCRPAGPAT